jgi:hypothetical protein
MGTAPSGGPSFPRHEEHVDEASFVALILASASISWPLTLGLFGCEDWLC